MVKKTRRNKKYIRRNKTNKSKTNKLYGGDDVSPIIEAKVESEPPKTEEQVESDKLLKEIENSHSVKKLLPDFSLGDSKILNEITELSEGLAMHSINKTAEFFDLDLNNSDNFKQRLEELKILLNKPENKQLMKELGTNFSKMGIIALEASSPFIEKLITEIFDKLTIVGNEFGKAGVKIALNTMTEIPGYGVIIGSIRSASNAAEAVLASSNAASEIITVSSDNLNAAVQNFEKILNEKKEMEGRIGGSINNFLNNSKNMPEKILGGNKVSKKTKTKKNVRFNI